eukprot:8494356-Pyramimonas_sp.AAC.1
MEKPSIQRQAISTTSDIGRFKGKGEFQQYLIRLNVEGSPIALHERLRFCCAQFVRGRGNLVGATLIAAVNTKSAITTSLPPL